MGEDKQTVASAIRPARLAAAFTLAEIQARPHHAETSSRSTPGLAGYLERPAAGQRLAAILAVAAVHLALIAILLAQRAQPGAGFQPLAAIHILQPDKPPIPPPPPVRPVLPPPDMPALPVPEIALAPPPPTHAITPTRQAPPGPARPLPSHFGASAGDSGLGVDVATSAGGGAGSRGAREDFDGAVKRAILSRKVQPSLAWDRRNTCVVNYRVTAAPDGGLASFSISPCAVPEINEAAKAAIRAAAPFPPPPPGSAGDVHGTLIFHP